MARCEQIGCDDPGPWAWREPHTGDVHWVCRPCGDRLVATIGGMLDPVATSQPKRRAKKATSALVKAAGIEIKDYTARIEASELLDRARKRHEQLRFVTFSGDASLIRLCDWCRERIRTTARSDSICCSTRCRQARHRFHRAVGKGVGSGRPIRLAYADPPYPGKAFYYPERTEVDQAELIGRLCSYDGWALSTSAAALRDVLASCPPGVRVAAWHRGERPNRLARGVLNAWEPVIFCGGRAVTSIDTRRIDSLTHYARPRTTDPARVIGSKPATFWGWLFQLLGATPLDTFEDLFPGSGGGDRAWRVFCSDVERDASEISTVRLFEPSRLESTRDASCDAGAGLRVASAGGPYG